MVIGRLIKAAALSTLLIVPSLAQFGLAGKKKATNFQDLQEQAKKKLNDPTAGLLDSFGGGDLSQLQELWQDAMKDPEAMKQFEQMGDTFKQAMEQMSKMSPEELQKQMQSVLGMLGENDILEGVLKKKDEIIAQLEATHAVPVEELAKYKADPEYFELKMRESFEQMGDILNNPDLLGQVAKGMGAAAKLLKDPSGLLNSIASELGDDTKIEEARLSILNGENPALAAMFDLPDMKEILSDPKKWRETVKEGTQNMLGNDEL